MSISDATKTTGSRMPAMFCFLLLSAMNIALAYPGVMTRDSFRQFGEARSGLLSDWHPPIMAWLWRQTMPLFDSGAQFLILHCLLYWGAIVLIAHILHVHRGGKWGLGMLLVGLLPPFVVMTMFVWKDTGMAVALLAAFALILHGKLSARRHVPTMIAAGVLLAYAVLVRANGIFAAAPLLVWMLSSIRTRPWRLVLACVVLIPVGIGMSAIVNHQVLNARSSKAYNSIKVYDVAGVAWISRDVSAYPVRPPLALIDRCYSKEQWDWIGRGVCGDLLTRRLKGIGPWVRSVTAHPLAYAGHRLLHFNEEMFLWVPYTAFRYRDTGGDPLAGVVEQPPLEDGIIAAHGRLASFPLFAPALYVVLACGMLAAGLRRWPSATPFTRAGIALLVASLLYAGGFLIIGVANMWRYQFFPEIGALAGGLLIAADQDYRRGLPAIERATLAAGAIVLTVATVARFVLVAPATRFVA
ncbi:hypothetical protein [Sphingomonas solaris]|uniref:Glycosyltransferase RgtA/B/C/D-like domain-containing protein n=1 Tax=Alterirhizorhabdus solaris TaxID=2529389 RepID=A0A558QVW8_9SPHN|nr:hypothetical protein [Sphingomonas solaris]TVV71265.1 hypothetical protein FOY91_17260 [Sphingomonas solaris]